MNAFVQNYNCAPQGFTLIIYEWCTDIVVFFPFFLAMQVLDFFSFVSLRLKLLSIPKLMALARSSTVFAYRWSFHMCCFGQNPASSSLCDSPKRHFIILKYRCFEDLRQGRPPTTVKVIEHAHVPSLAIKHSLVLFKFIVDQHHNNINVSMVCTCAKVKRHDISVLAPHMQWEKRHLCLEHPQP
jgi:hypothetical protein